MAAKWLTVVGDSLQLLGVVAIVWDVLDVRRVLGLPTLRSPVIQWARRVGRQLRNRLSRTKPQVIQGGATINLTAALTASGEVSGRLAGMPLRDELERLRKAVEAWMARTNRIVSEEAETRAAGFAGVQRDMRELHEEMKKFVTQVAGTHHVRRLVFAGFVLVGLILSLIGAVI